MLRMNRPGAKSGWGGRRLRVSAQSVRELIVGMIPLTSLAVALYRIPGMLMYVPLILMFFWKLLYGGLRLEKQYGLAGMVLLAVYFFCTIVSGFADMSSFFYIGLIFLFWLTIPDMAEAAAASPYRLLYIWAAIFGVLLLPRIIQGGDSFSVRNILVAMNAIEGEYRERPTFGFAHPNSAACMMAANIFLLCRLEELERRRKSLFLLKALLAADIALSFAGMLATGSRTATLSVLIFFAVRVFLGFRDGLGRPAKILINLVIALLFGYIVLDSGILAMLLANSSGRDRALMGILAAMKDTGHLLFGVGAASISAENLSPRLGFHTIVDGWYMYMFACLGVVGLALVIGVLGFVWIKLYGRTPAAGRPFELSLTAAFICYGFTENVILTPGVLLSVIVWILLYACSLEDGFSEEDT